MMRASDKAYAQLVAQIQTGELSPGTVLAEAEQAQRLGVSRTPAREAISRLVAEGFATQKSPRTTVVSGFDREEVVRLFEARRALEETAARLAARRGDREIFAGLADAFLAALSVNVNSRQQGAQGDALVSNNDDYFELIARFDREIDNAIDNSYIDSALRVIRTHLVRARKLARENNARLAQSVTEHQLIARAIASGDEELAVHATHVHLHNALEFFLQTVDRSEP